MKIVIAGAGEVGFHLAKMLAKESQDIVLIDNEQEKLTYAQNHIDVMTVKGNCTSLEVLQQANVQNADLFIGLTHAEEINITSAAISKKLGAQRTIARVNNVEFLNKKEIFDLKDIGVDEVISPEALVAKELSRLLKDSSVTDTFEFDDGKLELCGVVLCEKSPIINKSLAQARLAHPDDYSIIVAIHRNGQTLIPKGDDVFKVNDHVYYITTEGGKELGVYLSGKERKKIKNVMILGGSKTAVKVATALSSKYDIKLIEGDRDKCVELAERLPNVLVLNGDVRNVEFLEEEGLVNMDALIAITGNSETNIISSLIAKNHSVDKTIALVENINYIDLSMDIGIDTMVNKKIIAANFIFRYIRKGEVISLAALHGVNAEILEFEIKSTNKVCNKALNELNFPKSAIVGGVVREGKGFIAMGDFILRENDHVVIFSLPECIKKVEELFN